jgi:hypothetical protein
MKALKASRNLSSIKVEVGDNGFWYYLVTQKRDGKKLYGVIDKDTNQLFDCVYESITYIHRIDLQGYADYTINSMSGGVDNFSLFNYPMPDHFILERADTHEKLIYACDGKLIKGGFMGNLNYLGSWLIVNAKKIYTRQLDGYLRLMMVNTETGDLGLMTWDGKEVFKNDNFMIYTASKIPSNYNNTYAFNNRHLMGAVYLENLKYLVPVEYAEIRSLFTTMQFEVKLSPTETYHVFNPDVKEKFVPKNPGEQFFLDNKFEECINYYATNGVTDPNSKLYSALALYTMAVNKITVLKNHLQAPSVNKLTQYNYKEAKGLLNNAKVILQTAMLQDTLRRTQYQDAISNCDKNMGELETYNAQLKENSFGNMLLKSVLTGLAEGLKQAALNSVQNMLTGGGGRGNGSALSGSGASSTSTMGTSSSSSSRDASRKAEWESRKRAAEEQLERYQIELAKDPNNAALKHNIRSQEEIINTCNQNL